MSASPLVSVIIPMYNAAAFIRETIESALAQTYSPIEVIAIDDGSTDGTGTIVRDLAARDSRITYLYQENSGVSVSRNSALKRSKGEYIAFLDHDDLWHQEKLAVQMELFTQDPSAGLVFSNAFYAHTSKPVRILYSHRPPEGRIFEQLLLRSFLCLSTVMIRRAALTEQTEWFDPRLSIGEELDLFLRILYRWNARYADRPLATYRIHPGSYTVQHVPRIPVEKELILEKLLQHYPAISIHYARAIERLRARIQCDHAVLSGEREAITARQRLRPYTGVSRKALLCYLLTFVPGPLYRKIIGGCRAHMLR